MSYQVRYERYDVVVCDICDAFSFVGDRGWREMPEQHDGQALHLCRKCRPGAIWCHAHQQYHQPDVFHRQPCIDCGGLFTSVVRDQIVRCPACRRGMESSLTAAKPSAEQPRSLGQRIFGPLTRYRQ